MASIPQTAVVKLKEMGNVSEIMFSETRSKGGCIKKLNKDEYVNIRTGEVLPFQHSESRADDTSNVSKSLSRLRDLINTNVTDVTKCRFLTLTYAENMTDAERLNIDFKHTIQALHRRYGAFEYIGAAEPQARGAWHIHVILIFNETAPYMENEAVAKCWKQGFVRITKIDDVDNVGAYLTAYLGNMEVTEDNKNDLPEGKIIEADTIDENGNKVPKKFVKGARLHLYPAGFHICRKSKGIREPEETYITYAKAKERLSSSAQTYAKSIIVEDEKSGYKNLITKEFYNNKRKGSDTI